VPSSSIVLIGLGRTILYSRLRYQDFSRTASRRRVWSMLLCSGRHASGKALQFSNLDPQLQGLLHTRCLGDQTTLKAI
jgi:hypothetical protein